MANAGDFDGDFASEFKEEAVVAAAKAESGLRGLELLYIAAARGEITTSAMKYVERGFAVDPA